MPLSSLNYRTRCCRFCTHVQRAPQTQNDRLNLECEQALHIIGMRKQISFEQYGRKCDKYIYTE